jgi:hypothetical protein
VWGKPARTLFLDGKRLSSASITSGWQREGRRGAGKKGERPHLAFRAKEGGGGH